MISLLWPICIHLKDFFYTNVYALFLRVSQQLVSSQYLILIYIFAVSIH